MLPPRSEVEYLVGSAELAFSRQPMVPYDDLVCQLISQLSRELLSTREARQYPDVISFAYWCRKANMERLKDIFSEDECVRIGLGLAFHVSPSNVPINFAFSYVLSLLAGNANVVRVPSKDFPQTGLVCGAITKLFADPQYDRIARMTRLVRYEQNDTITGPFSAECDARVIWCGDEAIRTIRRLPTPARCVEIAFSDRYSFCVMDPNAVLQAEDGAVRKLAEAFYNDTFVLDQNACSSPHMVVWLNGAEDDVERAKQRFWQEVYEVTAAKYDLQPVHAVDKLAALCQAGVELDNIASVHRHGNFVYRVAVDSVSDDMDSLRGRFGFFYEYETADVNSLAHVVNTKYQTLTYFGVDKADLVAFVVDNGLRGIDRIVPVGQALDMDVRWDGYDVIRSLSRIVDVK